MIEFFKLVPGGHAPRRADASALGTLPTAGFRYCEPVRSASRYGWYVFLPCDLGLIWEDDVIHFTLDGFETRYILNDAIQYPDFAAQFDAASPEDIRGYSNPFVARTMDPDIIQIWTGCVVRTEPGTSLWVRGPVNFAHQTSFSVLEGVIETDRWIGPLFTNIRLTGRNTPILFQRNMPLLQVLPLERTFEQRAVKAKPEVTEGLEDLSPDFWDAYRGTVVDRLKAKLPAGDYAVSARKNRKNQPKAQED